MSASAMDRWYELNDDHRDHPSVFVNRPTSLPSVYVETLSTGCGTPDVLPDGPVRARLTIGGVTFYGPLDELDLLIDAVREVMDEAKERAAHLAAVRDLEKAAE